MAVTNAFIVGIMSALLPGPDLILLIKNSLQSGRSQGVATSLGVATALIIHIAYTILGFAILIEMFPSLLNTIKVLGALYLVWLGWKTIRGQSKVVNEPTEGKPAKNHSIKNSFSEGFMCNLLNPNSALFFLSVFSQLIHTSTPIYMSWLYGFIVILIVFLFYAIFAFFISNMKFRRFYFVYKQWFDNTLGLILIGFALSIGLSVFNSG
ncbi:LysE family translocator [Virgibacillus sp. NKC19-3]|uniref:LysE family translocator n=1 Tax=Virgibacillus saliphilus TaxID=2831674 RepID=UPI001C9B9CBB|nr:LysE family translocator [Virgibacillus sp. NKC19-3]MBY7142435.1 LysE family translocator [Virgibacillus sp. NKC19-3]